MHAEPTHCPCEVPIAETRRVVMMLLLSDEHSPWSAAELQREIAGVRGDPIDVLDAINDLHGAGLVNVCGEFVTPTRAARYSDALHLGAI